MPKTFLAMDLETTWDEQLHEAHRSFDRKSKERAMACRRIMAAAIFPFTLDEEGRVSTGPVISWNEHDWGDEQAVVARLFDFLRAREGDTVLSYAGVAQDVPLLILAAMEYGLTLPPQLLDQPGRKGPRPHLDLGLQLKGGGRSWHHLSQVALRQGVPLELVSAKADVPQPTDAKGWRELSDHCELDCLLLGLAKLGWLTAQGWPGLRLTAAMIALIAGFLRKRPDHAKAPALKAYAAELQSRLAMDYEAAA